MAKTLSPFVYWAQNDTHVYLKVDLKDVKDVKVAIEDDDIEYSSLGNSDGNRFVKCI